MAADKLTERIPRSIEARAINLFEQASLLKTGKVWRWGEADADMRNRWRLMAFIERDEREKKCGTVTLYKKR